MPRKFAEIKQEILADPVKRERGEREKAAMRAAMRLADIREQRQQTQVGLAEMLGTTQANISRIERTDNPYLRTLADYVAGLGGHLEINAVFDDEVLPIGTVETEQEPVEA